MSTRKEPQSKASGKFVYLFAAGRTDGTADMKDLLGGKGANLAEMASLGLPVPPGFTITTEVCTAYYANGRKLPDGLKAEVEAALAEIGKAVGASFGDVKSPLLVSVRSGARASMPGMMDTILNLGLNDETVKGLAAKSGSERFAYDSYRRFIQMYSNVVLDVDHGVFEDILENHKNLNGHTLDTDLARRRLARGDRRLQGGDRARDRQALPAVHGRAAVGRDRRRVRLLAERSAPTPTAACTASPTAGARPSTCRPWCSATSATISATGVAFTRNPSTGAREIYGEFLVNAQGEDVVAGIRTPQPLTEAARKAAGEKLPSLEALMPDTYRQLAEVFATLESRYRDMQDIEFTIQDGRLWMLQTRSGKRTAEAALKIAVDLCSEGVIDAEEAVMRIDADALDQLLHPTIDPDRRTSRWWRAACRRRRAPPPARSCSTPTRPRS